MPIQQNPALRIEQVSVEKLCTLAASGELYAIADATDAPAVPRKVLELGPERAVSLYRGTAEEEFWEVAPYLMHVDPTVLDWILSTLDMTRWGIFTVSKANLATLRTHFRHFLKVQPPEGDPWFFRFYDPRVLKPFLTSCSSQELRMFLGPSSAYGANGPAIGDVFLFLPIRPASSSYDSASPAKYSTTFPLRPEHIDALQAQAEASFRQRLMRHLRNERVPGVDELDDIRLEARISFGINRARKYGFKLPVNFATFVAFMFRFAPNFDLHPHVHAVLTDAAVDCEFRFNVLVQRISDLEWRQIVSGADQTLWPHAE